jgi:hypothetical protein
MVEIYFGILKTHEEDRAARILFDMAFHDYDTTLARVPTSTSPFLLSGMLPSLTIGLAA